VDYQVLSNTRANDPTVTISAIVDVDSAFGRGRTCYGWKPNGWLRLVTRLRCDAPAGPGGFLYKGV